MEQIGKTKVNFKRKRAREGVTEIRVQNKKAGKLCYEAEAENEALIQRATRGCFLKHFLAAEPRRIIFLVVTLTAGVVVLVNRYASMHPANK